MLPRNFCVWLRAMLHDRGERPLTASESAAIREALADVFRHGIDPMMGDAVHQALLDNIHFPGKRV